MARKREVTRTIIGTKAVVMTVDTAQGTTENKEVTLSAKFDDEKKVLKAVEKLDLGENIKPVHVVAFENFETLYAMDEQKFIELAEARAPRGTEA